MQDPALVGYAAVQDDAGTPYLLNGGSLGPTVNATTLDELKMYLGSPNPYVVTFSGLIQGTDSVNVTSEQDAARHRKRCPPAGASSFR